MEKITSPSNEKVKQAVKLCSSSSYRSSQELFVLEGVRLCFEALLSEVPLARLFVTEKAAAVNAELVKDLEKVAQESFLITQEISEKISDTTSPQGLFCICRATESHKPDAINYSGKYIALENIQDPSNLGAISRTAEALGLDGIILAGGCDIHNPKALRASMGSLLRACIIRTSSLPDFLLSLSQNGMRTLAAVADSSAQSITDIDMQGGIVCLVGNEGNGLSQQAAAACTDKVTIKMCGNTESLNAGAASAILMWEIMR